MYDGGQWIIMYVWWRPVNYPLFWSRRRIWSWQEGRQLEQVLDGSCGWPGGPHVTFNVWKQNILELTGDNLGRPFTSSMGQAQVSPKWLIWGLLIFGFLNFLQLYLPHHQFTSEHVWVCVMGFGPLKIQLIRILNLSLHWRFKHVRNNFQQYFGI